MERAYFLVRHVGAAEHVAQVADDGGALFGAAEEAVAVHFGFEPFVEFDQFIVAGGMAVAGGHLAFGRVHVVKRPFIGQQQHGLAKVQRGKGRVQRDGHDGMGKGRVVVGQAAAFRAEQDGGALAFGVAAGKLGAGGAGGQDGFDHAARARGRGDDIVAVRDGGRRGIINADGGHDFKRPGGHGVRAFIRPAIARVDDAQAIKPAIEHGTGRRADIFPHLGIDEDNQRAGACGGGVGLGVVGRGHGAAYSTGVSRKSTMAGQAGRIIIARNYGNLKVY